MAQRWTIRSSEDLGRAVAELRRRRGLTQAELAANTGLGRSWLAHLETGHTTAVLDHLLLLLRRLGATITVTIGDDDA
jgi:HTH-type transcriptional regulator/antitoxin HipB